MPPAELTLNPPLRRWHVLLAFGVIAAVYLGSVNNRWWPSPDSALYVGLGRSLAAGTGYQFNDERGLHVAPGLPAAIALGDRLFGRNYWFANLLNGLAGTASLVLTYVTLGRLTDRRASLAVTMMAAFNYVFFSQAQFVHTDIIFVALAWAVLYALVRLQSGSGWWMIPAAALLLVSLSVRIPGGLLFGVMAIGLVLERKLPARRGRRVVSGAAVLGLLVAVAGVFAAAAWRLTGTIPVYFARLLPGSRTRATNLIAQPGGGFMRFVETLAKFSSSQNDWYWLGFVLLPLYVIGLVILWRRGQRLFASLILLYPLALALLSRAASLPQRYLLPVLPLLFLAMLEGLLWLVAQVARLRRRPVSGTDLLRAATVFTVLIIGANAPRVARVAFHQICSSRTDRYYDRIQHGKFAETVKVGEFLRAADHPGAPAFAVYNARILHVLSDRLILSTRITRKNHIADADRMHNAFLSSGQARFAVLNFQDIDEPARRHLKALFASTEGLKLVFSGDDYQVYQRTGLPATQPATTQEQPENAPG